MMPIHWGLFNLALHAWKQPVERMLEIAEEKGIPLWLPEPGAPTEVGGSCGRGGGSGRSKGRLRGRQIFGVAERRARTGEKQVPRLARDDNFFQKLSKNGNGNGNSKGACRSLHFASQRQERDAAVERTGVWVGRAGARALPYL